MTWRANRAYKSSMAKRPPFDEAIARVGGKAALAKALGITKSAVSQWKELPPKHVLKVAQLSGFKCHELRPDIFPAEAA